VRGYALDSGSSRLDTAPEKVPFDWWLKTWPAMTFHRPALGVNVQAVCPSPLSEIFRICLFFILPGPCHEWGPPALIILPLTCLWGELMKPLAAHNAASLRPADAFSLRNLLAGLSHQEWFMRVAGSKPARWRYLPSGKIATAFHRCYKCWRPFAASVLTPRSAGEEFSSGHAGPDMLGILRKICFSWRGIGAVPHGG